MPERPRTPFDSRTADLAVLAPWLLELVRTARGLVRAYLPGGPVDARTRERVILAVTEVNGCRYTAWVHSSWAAFLGDDVEDPADAEAALLDHARSCAEAGRPLDVGALTAVLPPEAVAVVRATIAEVEVSNLVGNTVDGLLATLTGRRPFAPLRLAGEAVTVAAALPLAMPLVATAAAMRVVSRLAPRLPEVQAPADDDANLLVHVLARAVPAYLANAGVRLVALRFPAPVSIGIRAGRSAATIRIGRGRVAIDNGISPDVLMVLEGDIEPLLQAATGSLVRELAALRLKRD